MKLVPYAPTVGSLMYVTVATRPDIAHVVGVVSRFMHNPGRSHWNAVKHVFKYLPDTKNHGILFGLNKNSTVVGYTDSDFAGCVDSRKSTTGYCFKFGNGTISWKSKLQECMTTSKTEAEYVVASDAAKEALWLGRLAHTFRQVDSDSAPIVYNDNQGVVTLSKNSVHHNVSKHIDIRYHFVRDCVISGKISLEKISTTDNVADRMTKCLLADRF